MMSSVFKEKHTGSDVARVTKVRAAVLGTRGCGDKYATSDRDRDRDHEHDRVTEKMTERIKMTAKGSLTVGTWNVRSLFQAGKYEILKREMDKYRYDVIGICETRWTGSGEMPDRRIIWSGGDRKNKHGVALLMSEKASKALIGYRAVNERLMYARYSGYPRNISVMVIYAPTMEYGEEDLEKFYETVEEVLKEIPKQDMKIIVGDWNAKIGNDNTGWEEVMGKYGFGEINERGERLLQFAVQNNMFVTNTKFPGRKQKKWTWEAPGGRYRNMIDYILIEKKWRGFVTQSRSFPGADIGSDHQLVLCNISVKMKSEKKKKESKTIRYNTEILKSEEGKQKVRVVLEKELESKHNGKETMGMDERAKALEHGLKKAAEEMKMNYIPRKHWISESTMRLVEKRRQLKASKNETEEKATEYKYLCKRIKKSARMDKRQWVNSVCDEVEKHVGTAKTRQAYCAIKQLRGKFEARHGSVNDKDGKLITDRNKVMKRWTEYVKDLFTDNNRYEKSTLEELKRRTLPQEVTEVDDGILREEVEKAIKKLKNNKSTGPDGIPAELIKAGGNQVIEEVHRICEDIWNTGRWPQDWCKSTLIMLPKKGNKMECANYRSIALIPHICKIMLNIVQERMSGALEEHMSEEQGGFRKDRSTVQQILTLRLLAEKAMDKGKNLYNCFVDFRKAFDSVWHEGLWAILQRMGVSAKLVQVVQGLYQQSEMAVKIDGVLGEWIKPTVGSRQGDPTSPRLFLAELEQVMEKVECTDVGGINVNGQTVKDLRFADDIDLLAMNEEEMQEEMNELYESSERFGLHINEGKTKAMVIGKNKDKMEIKINGQEIECVDKFVYLGSLITNDNSCSQEVKRRIAIAGEAFGSLNEIWKSKNVSRRSKMKVFNSCVVSTLLYGCETWTLRKIDTEKLDAFERKCFRKMLGISWMDKVRNEEVESRIGQVKKASQKVKERKLSMFGHICRMQDNRLIKLVMMGDMYGTRKRGRPHRKWLDDIREWCGSTVQEAINMARERRHPFGKR